MGRKGLIIIVSGPSGVGKTTITQRLLGAMRGIRQCVTYTTRCRRPDEKDGVDYNFVDDAAFSALVRDDLLAEWAVINGYRYGTPKSGIEKITSSGDDVVLVIDVRGAASIKSLYSSAISIFIKPPSLNVLRERLAERGEQDRVDLRLGRAGTELSQAHAYDYVLVNDTVDEVIAALRDIIEKARAER